MGVCLVARTLSDEKIDALLKDPPLVWRVLAPEDDALYLDAVGRRAPPGWLARLFGRAVDRPPPIPRFTFGEDETHELDLDKAWDGVNFCLKQLTDAGQVPNFFRDGVPVGQVEVGYGPARCLKSDVVERIAEAYGAIDEQRLKQVYAPEKMGDVYLAHVWQEEGDDGWEYLRTNFLALRNFLQLAAKHRLGVLVRFT